MTDKLLIKRELLERLEHVTRNLVPHLQCHTDLVAALAAPRQPDSNPFFDNRIARELLEDRTQQWPMSAPRQPEGEGLEVRRPVSTPNHNHAMRRGNS